MIPLNSRQGLPPSAFWYVALRSLAAAVFLVLIGRVFQFASNASHVACRGALCGSVTGGHTGVLIYLFAIFLVVNAILRYKWFSFVLTDKNISIDSGVLFRKSCTIRFDRIQDVNTIRNPLHMMLGLASVAIWTASLDQRVGNANRPDGLIVLNTDTADWLKEYLTDPPTARGGDSAPSHNSPPVAGAIPARHGSAWIVLIFAAAIALVFLVLRNATPVTAPVASTASTAQSAPSAPTVTGPASVVRPNADGTKNHLRKVQPAQSDAGAEAKSYTTSCAIRQPGGMDGVSLCADLKEGGRCEHEADFRSHPTQEPAVLTVVNRSSEIVRFYWLDLSGARSLYASLPPGGHVDQQSHIGAYWLTSTADGHCVGIISAATKSVGIF
ncbi:MAG TPA: PH domain-containing protein [Steroidobacteraceae bacterium]|nr:PH domain-containing protein [Steroidobacteraceae bacterium]